MCSVPDTKDGTSICVPNETKILIDVSVAQRRNRLAQSASDGEENVSTTDRKVRLTCSSSISKPMTAIGTQSKVPEPIPVDQPPANPAPKANGNGNPAVHGNGNEQSLEDFIKRLDVFQPTLANFSSPSQLTNYDPAYPSAPFFQPNVNPTATNPHSTYDDLQFASLFGMYVGKDSPGQTLPTNWNDLDFLNFDFTVNPDGNGSSNGNESSPSTRGTNHSATQQQNPIAQSSPAEEEMTSSEEEYLYVFCRLYSTWLIVLDCGCTSPTSEFLASRCTSSHSIPTYDHPTLISAPIHAYSTLWCVSAVLSLMRQYLMTCRASPVAHIRAREDYFFDLGARGIDDALGRDKKLFDAMRAATLLSTWLCGMGRYQEVGTSLRQCGELTGIGMDHGWEGKVVSPGAHFRVERSSRSRY